MSLAKKKIFSWLFLVGFGLLEVVSLNGAILPARAQTNNDNFFNSQTGIVEVGQVYGNQKTDVRVVIMNIISIVLGFLALLFLVLTLMAGFRYMTAAGNEEKARGAMKQLANALIGLLIILLSLAITRFIVNRLSAAINNNIDLFHPY